MRGRGKASARYTVKSYSISTAETYFCKLKGYNISIGLILIQVNVTCIPEEENHTVQ